MTIRPSPQPRSYTMSSGPTFATSSIERTSSFCVGTNGTSGDLAGGAGALVWATARPTSSPVAATDTSTTNQIESLPTRVMCSPCAPAATCAVYTGTVCDPAYLGARVSSRPFLPLLVLCAFAAPAAAQSGLSPVERRIVRAAEAEVPAALEL